LPIDPINPNQPGAYNVGRLGTSIPYNQLGIQGINTRPVIIPEGIILRKKIAKEFGVEVVDSDVKFSSVEVAIIGETLEEIQKKKRQHLMGVKQIIKNREHRIRLLSGLRIDAGGAYDADSKRIYVFDNVTPEGIPEVLVHEIGHAVSHFNLEFAEFMEFVKDAGYNMTEFRKFFIPGNKFHQIGLKPVEIDKEDWESVVDRFSMKSLTRNSDIFGEIILKLNHKKKHPMDENPLEAFAWAYEWYVNKNPEFKELASRAAKAGDYTFFNRYSFMDKEIFSEF